MTTQKITALLAYPVHVLLLHRSLRKRQRMIDRGHTMVWFLPICCSEDGAEEKGSGDGDDILVYGFTSSTIVPREEGVQALRDLKQRYKLKRTLQENWDRCSSANWKGLWWRPVSWWRENATRNWCLTAVIFLTVRIFQLCHMVLRWKTMFLMYGDWRRYYKWSDGNC